MALDIAHNGALDDTSDNVLVGGLKRALHGELYFAIDGALDGVLMVDMIVH